jgi:hypothetical protein
LGAIDRAAAHHENTRPNTYNATRIAASTISTPT